MRIYSIILVVLGIVLIGGCGNQIDTENRGVITQYVCPDKTIVDNPDNCPKQEESQYAKSIDAKPVDVLQIPQYEDLDCSKTENQNITYVKVEVSMNTDDTSVNPNYRWYPSLNEGRINWVSVWGYNKGCTKIRFPTLSEIFILYNNSIMFYNQNDENFVGKEGDFAYPADLVIQIADIGGVGIIVKERGLYKAIVVVRDSKTGEIVGGNQAEFDM